MQTAKRGLVVFLWENHNSAADLCVFLESAPPGARGLLKNAPYFHVCLSRKLCESAPLRGQVHGRFGRGSGRQMGFARALLCRCACANPFCANWYPSRSVFPHRESCHYLHRLWADFWSQNRHRKIIPAERTKKCNGLCVSPFVRASLSQFGLIFLTLAWRCFLLN